MIANAPNPAGAGILNSAKAFDGRGISPIGLLVGAMPPTLIAIVCFWYLPHSMPEKVVAAESAVVTDLVEVIAPSGVGQP